MLRRRGSVSNFEPDVEMCDPAAPEQGSRRRQRLSFWVQRPDPHANLRGVCFGVQIHRSGTLVIHAEGGKRQHLAPGTWIECNTETA
jgi:hypothetical protein